MLEKIDGLLGAKGQAVDRGRARCPAATFAADGFDAEVDGAEGRLSLSRPARSRAGWSRLYGTQRARAAWRSRRSQADLGRHFGADLYEAEVRYLMRARMGA